MNHKIIIMLLLILTVTSMSNGKEERSLVAHVSFSDGSKLDVNYFSFCSDNKTFLGGVYQQGVWDLEKPLRLVVDDYYVYRIRIEDARALSLESVMDSGRCRRFHVNASLKEDISLEGVLYLEEGCTDDEFDYLWISYDHEVLGRKEGKEENKFERCVFYEMRGIWRKVHSCYFAQWVSEHIQGQIRYIPCEFL